MPVVDTSRTVATTAEACREAALDLLRAASGSMRVTDWRAQVAAAAPDLHPDDAWFAAWSLVEDRTVGYDPQTGTVQLLH